MIALGAIALLFGISAFKTYTTYRNELLRRQILDHEKLNRIIRQSLNQYFLRIQQVTEHAAAHPEFQPDKTSAEDQLRFRDMQRSTAEAIQRARQIVRILPEDEKILNRKQSNVIQTWQLFKGLPDVDSNGEDLTRRKLASHWMRAFHDLFLIFEEDANGDMVLVVPFYQQKNISTFNFSFRDYLVGPKETRATVLSDAFVSRVVNSTQALAVSSPIFDKSGNVTKVVAAAVSNDTLRKVVFQPLRADIHSSEDTVFYFIDRYGHMIASSSSSQDDGRLPSTTACVANYEPLPKASTDAGDPGNLRKYGPLILMPWKDDEFERDTDFKRDSQTWNESLLRASYTDVYQNCDGATVLGSFYPVSLVDGRSPRYGILIETPTKVNRGGKALTVVFGVAAFVLLSTLGFLGAAIWVRNARVTREFTENYAHLQQKASRASHDLRSPLVALQMLEPQLANQPDNIRKMFRDLVNRIGDIANKLERSEEVR